jgi:hypothetical protein
MHFREGIFFSGIPSGWRDSIVFGKIGGGDGKILLKAAFSFFSRTGFLPKIRSLSTPMVSRGEETAAEQKMSTGTFWATKIREA